MRPRGRVSLLAAALLAVAGLAAGAAPAVENGQASARAGGPQRAFYGVAPQRLPGPDDIRRMGRGEVGTLRFQLRWSAVDPTPAPGDYDWSEVDRIVGASARHGIRALPFAYSTPDWVATGLDGHDCDADCFAYPPRSRLALEAWSGFLAAAAARYGPGGSFWGEHPELPPLPVREWQIWNEQNSIPFFRPEPSVARYADLLLSAAVGLKLTDPGARVVLGGMYGTPNHGERPAITAWRFLRRLYELERGPAFDAVAAHPYALGVDGVEAQLVRLRRAMRANGDARTPLWVTEVGWSSGRSEHPYDHGPGGQANRLRDLLSTLTRKRRAYRLRRLVWFSWRDDTAGLAVCDWCPRSGLFREATLTPKPAWRAFTEFTGGR